MKLRNAVGALCATAVLAGRHADLLAGPAGALARAYALRASLRGKVEV